MGERHPSSLAINNQYFEKTYIFKNSIISGDNGEAPDTIMRTRPPSFSFILLKTNLSQTGDGFLPGIKSIKSQVELQTDLLWELMT